MEGLEGGDAGMGVSSDSEEDKCGTGGGKGSDFGPMKATR